MSTNDRREGAAMSGAASLAPALALLEIQSLARGVICADAAAKRAPIELLLCEAVSPGKYLLLFAGGVAEVEESFAAAKAVAADSLLDSLFLPQAHPFLLPAIRAGSIGIPTISSSRANEGAGVLELLSVAAALRCADAACKNAAVELQFLHLARGIGGKAWFILRGALSDLESAMLAAQEIAGTGLVAGAEIIAAPAAELISKAL
jgi:microcompartment protein CcmL/EutN